MPNMPMPVKAGTFLVLATSNLIDILVELTKQEGARLHRHGHYFMIGKPGPGSIAEAMLRQLPVLVECNSWTLPQERYNAEWVTEKDVGIVLQNFREVAQGVRDMLVPATLRDCAAMSRP